MAILSTTPVAKIYQNLKIIIFFCSIYIGEWKPHSAFFIHAYFEFSTHSNASINLLVVKEHDRLRFLFTFSYFQQHFTLQCVSLLCSSCLAVDWQIKQDITCSFTFGSSIKQTIPLTVLVTTFILLYGTKIQRNF